MAGTVAFLDGAGTGSVLWVSSANPLPVTGVSVTIASVDIDQTTPGTTNGVVLKDGSGNVLTYGSSTGTLSSVAGSGTAVTLLAANPARVGATIVNESSAILYIGLSATTPTNALYTVALPAAGTTGASFEIPFGYRGIVQGIWASAAGNARITEFS